MHIALGIFGIVLILTVVLDVLSTTLRLEGGGPLTAWTTTALWRLALRLTPTHRALSVAGFAIVLLTVILWINLVWLGWTLVLGMGERAVLDSHSGQPADFWQRLYFTGSMLITFGTSDYRPGSSPWRVLTAIAAANGFFMVTLIITYLLPLVTTEMQRRQLAVHISTLGCTPQDLLLRAWNGSDFGLLPGHLLLLTPRMMELGQGHLAYPVLHCFHSRDRDAALAPSVAVLDEALTLLEGVEPRLRPDRAAIYPLREAIQHFLETLSEAHLEPKRKPPPPPPLDRLREAGIKTVDDGEMQRIVEGLSKRRRHLNGLVEQEGWRWEDVTGTSPSVSPS